MGQNAVKTENYWNHEELARKTKQGTNLPEKTVVGREHAPVEGHNLCILVVSQYVVEGQVTHLNKKKSNLTPRQPTGHQEFE